MLLSEYDTECLAQAKKLIDADLSVHYSIATIAHSTGLGATKLKTGFKAAYGYSLFAYLRMQRMKKAAELLSDSRKTIKQIAKATGFRYMNNFIRAFSANYSVSPAAYRKNLLPK
ncbi:helix-turn-helix domain-containing protein [Ferruginibacter sp. SUN106]|uniref:helix-turn-helix domain-containing protein n=1 Tax=Ferruginibacter sp. SUN106 TaxID=2978348 RepID=UPI003D361A94